MARGSEKHRKPSTNFRAARFWIISRLLLPLLIIPVKLLMRTWRYRIEPSTWLEDYCKPAGRPRTVACLHGSALLMVAMTYLSRRHGWIDSTTMVSPSRDGRLLSDLLARFGQKTVAGSSSKRGVSALRELIEVTRRGSIGTISVDGPKGPRCHPHKGIFQLASATGATLLAGCTSASPAIRLKSWDRQLVPLPFARVSFRFIMLHDYSEGPFDGDERQALQNLFLENLRKDGEPVDDITSMSAP